MKVDLQNNFSYSPTKKLNPGTLTDCLLIYLIWLLQVKGYFRFHVD